MHGHCDPPLAGRLLKRRKLPSRRCAGIRKRGDPSNTGKYFQQQLLPFAVQFTRENANAGRVALWAGNGVHQPCT
jgi:hypothetical protein